MFEDLGKYMIRLLLLLLVITLVIGCVAGVGVKYLIDWLIK